ncbi:MAG: hypothetical protein E2O88_11525 [Bacteroidetes bacterium]|nr:MAG: hypothetical protein E2O88_11525 [Bacteroidota bacterium]
MFRDLLFLVFTLSCTWMVLKGLSKYQVPSRKFLIIVSLWILLLALLSLSGLLNDFSNFPPRMMLVMLVPFTLIVWFVVSSHSNNLLSRVPASWIIKMQGFRVIVELFLWWAYLDQVVPVQMTFEGRNFDILVGLSAPLVSLWWLKPSNQRLQWVLIWNVVGLILLFNIVVVAVLSMPTPMQYFFNEPANTVVASFPWVLLPGILVTLAFALHLLSIKQMIKMMKTASTSA